MIETLRVRVFGELRLDGADISTLRSRKARTLLKMLAVQIGQAVDVDTLIDGLWPTALPAEPARELAVLVSRARGVVGNERLLRREHGYVLRADWCDLDEVGALVREATARSERGDPSGASVVAEAALRLASSPLLADEPDADWLRPHRAAAAATVAAARAIAADAALANGRIGEATAQARHALRHDPYDEVALRLLMRAHTVAGRPASALAAYAEARERLAEDLGVSPTAATEAVHAAILSGELAPQLPRPVGASRLTGRGGEVALLEDAWRRSRRAAEIVLVTGPADAGASHLVHAWAGSVPGEPLVLEGRAERGIEMPLQPVLDALAALNDGDDAGDEQVVGAGWWGLPGPSATTTAMQEEVFAGLARRLRALTPPGGLVLIIHDIEVADPMTREWLASLLRRPEDLPILVLVTHHVGLPPNHDDCAVPASMVVELEPLPPPAVAALPDAERPDWTWARSGGAAAVTLVTAAVLGAAVDLDLLAGVLGASPLDVLAHLDDGVRRSFLTERDGRMVFRHEPVRDALVAEATVERRAWVHRQAAQLLASRPAASPVDIALHARAGGDLVLCAEALADAADVARGRFDLAGAERLLDDAVHLHDTAELRLRRSRLRMARGDLSGADRDAEAALGLGAGARALELRAWAARNRHDMETAIRLGTAGADAAEDATTHASCLLAVALARRGIGDLPQADAVLAEAAALHPAASLGLQAWVGVLRVHQGRAGEALGALEPMVGAEAGGLLSFWVEHVLQMLAHAYGHLGRAADAMAMLDRLDVELERRGSAVRYGGVTMTYRSWILRNVGDPAAAQVARAGIEQARTPEIRAQSLLDLADTLIGPGSGSVDVAGARRVLDDAIVAIDTRWFHNRWRAEQRCGVITARLHLAAGEPDDALHVATSTASIADARGDARYAVLARLLAARAEARRGERIDAATVHGDLGRLEHVAGMEAWWMAADLADDLAADLAADRATADHAAFIARRSAQRLVAEAGEHGPALQSLISARLG